MKYILVDETKTDMFTKEFDDKQKALEEGEREFALLTSFDKKRRLGFYVLESINPDEDAENHFDGNIIKQWI